MKPAKRPETLPPVRPNAGIEAAYRIKMQKLIEEMSASVEYWLKAAYRANEPKIVAVDELPASALKKAFAELARRWERRFDKAALELADYFAKTAQDRSDRALRSILRRGGFSVEFKMTPAMQDILRATITANVSLIKSIPQQYLTQVEGSVMRSVQTGRDLGTLSKELQDHYGVSKRRAAIIARSQNNMATASMTRARQTEVGIKEAIWVHSSGGRKPRPNHVAFGRERKRYDVNKGIWDPDAKGKNKGEFIWPGQLVSCLCVSKSVIPGLT